MQQLPYNAHKDNSEHEYNMYIHVASTHLNRGYHGAEGKYGGTVFDCGLVIKGSLGVQQQDGYLRR